MALHFLYFYVTVQGRRRVLLAGGPVCGVWETGRRKSPSGVQGQSPGRRSGGLSPPEADDADDILWISVISMNFGERFKAFTIHTVLRRGGSPYVKKFPSDLWKSQVTFVVTDGVRTPCPVYAPV